MGQGAMLTPEEQNAAAVAYALDRADRYRNDSCCRAVMDDVMQWLCDGEHIKAWECGELDDLKDIPIVKKALTGKYK